jgi:hypothetical protein
MSSPTDPAPPRSGSSRRSFLRTSGGLATGIAVTILPSGVVQLAAPGSADAREPASPRIEPVGDVPHETVMAYVHDAEGGVVTVVSGAAEKTYRDPALAKRLMDAASRTA